MVLKVISHNEMFSVHFPVKQTLVHFHISVVWSNQTKETIQGPFKVEQTPVSVFDQKVIDKRIYCHSHSFIYYHYFILLCGSFFFLFWFLAIWAVFCTIWVVLETPTKLQTEIFG